MNELGNVTFSYANLSPSPHNVTMLVTDDAGATCSSNIVLEVAGGPEISIAFPNDGAVVNENTPVYFEATILDDTTPSQYLNVTLSSSIDGDLEIPPLDSTGNLTTYLSNLSIGEHILTIQAIDEDEMMNNKILQLRINGIPTPPEIQILPDLPVEGIDDLTCSIVLDGTDPDGDPLSYNYMWEVDGQITTHTTDTIFASDTHFGETWTCMAQSNDRSKAGVPLEFVGHSVISSRGQAWQCSFDGKQ